MPKTISTRNLKFNKKKKNDTGNSKILGVAGSMGIKSASELGLKADSLGITKRKAKTHKGRKIMESREAMTFENPKKCVMIKGNKTSEKCMALIRDLHLIRGGNDHSKLFLRKSHPISPFEDVNGLEAMANKQNCNLFLCGTHQKKRPDNLVFGRLFSSHVLDMFEFGVDNYEPISSFNAKEVNA